MPLPAVVHERYIYQKQNQKVVARRNRCAESTAPTGVPCPAADSTLLPPPQRGKIAAAATAFLLLPVLPSFLPPGKGHKGEGRLGNGTKPPCLHTTTTTTGHAYFSHRPRRHQHQQAMPKLPPPSPPPAFTCLPARASSQRYSSTYRQELTERESSSRDHLRTGETQKESMSQRSIWREEMRERLGGGSEFRERRGEER